MNAAPLRIVLLGAGHANLLAVPALRAGLADAAITLIDAAAEATYSGMLPGHVAGHYDADELRVPLAGFAGRHGIDFRRGRIVRIEPAARQIRLEDGTDLTFDLAALDVGSHTRMPEIPGFTDYALPIKPLDVFAARLAGLDAATPVAIVGGGVAGAEIALALAHRGSRRVTVIEAGAMLAPALGARARRHLLAALARADVALFANARVAAVEERGVVLEDGRRIASGLTLGIAGARAPDWLGQTLPVDAAGFVRVSPALEVEGCPGLFAAGDCAALMHAPRPKAGVFAVRQAPVLAANLIAAARDRPIARYDPQADYLKIISLGGRTALAEWHGLTLRGAWLWQLKDRIDRSFMARLQG